MCNPFGGLGLTGGLLDAAALADSLIAIAQGLATEGILDCYAEERRKIFLEVVNPISQANKERLHKTNPDTVGESDPFLRQLRAADSNKHQHIRSHDKLALDMSQFYTQNSRGGETR